MGDITWQERECLKSFVGESIDDLTSREFDLAWRLFVQGKIRLEDGKVARIPVSYGDGKKSAYGVTYADEITGEFS